MQDIQLQLTLDEVNLILNALGNLPYSQVFQLIQKIDSQAVSQLQAGNQGQSNLPFPTQQP